MNNKTLLILGVSSSIGLPLAKTLLKQKYNIIGQYNKKTKDLVKLKNLYKNSLTLLKTNFTNKKQFSGFLQFISDEQIPLDGIIHLVAPKIEMKPISKTTWKDIDQNLEIQFKSLYFTLQVCLKKILNSDFKRIIVVNSEIITHRNIPKGFTAYAIAKSAINQYLNCLNSELESKNVYINQISPTMFKSSLLENIPNYVIEKQKIESDITPEKNILPKILFLLSEKGKKSKNKTFVIK